MPLLLTYNRPKLIRFNHMQLSPTLPFSVSRYYGILITYGMTYNNHIIIHSAMTGLGLALARSINCSMSV